MLLIVWHSRTGAARAMADAAFTGALSTAMGIEHAGSVARLLAADRARPEDFLAASAYVFVCPENLGTMSGVMKDAFDRCYYPLLGRIEGRAYATASAAGSNGSGAQAQIDRIVTGWRLRRVAEPFIVNLGAQTAEAIMAPKVVPPQSLNKCHELGQALAEGLSLGLF